MFRMEAPSKKINHTNPITKYIGSIFTINQTHLKIGNIDEGYGLFFILISTFTYIISSATLICGSTLHRATFPFAIFLSILTLYFTLRNSISIKLIFRLVFQALLVLSLCLFISALINDHSFDGNSYHQETVALLMNGWNPQNPSDFKDIPIWSIHYARGLEIIEAAISITFNDIECGKGINLILAIACFFYVKAFCLQTLNQLKKTYINLIAIAITCMPITCSQIFTFYIDFTGYIYFLLTILLIIRLSSLSRSDKSQHIRIFIPYICCIILSIGTKFNIFAYEMLVLLLSALWLIYQHKTHIFFILLNVSILSILAGIILNFNPYITNYIHYGNPFYPLMGANSLDIMTGNTPEMFGNGRLLDFIHSILSVKPPTYDQRIGGFGPLMFLILLTSLVILIVSFKRIPKVCKYIAVCAFASCFIFDQTWWARYIPQLWLVPSVALYVAFRYSKLKFLSVSLLSLMLISSALAFACGVLPNARLSAIRYATYREVKNQSAVISFPNHQFLQHLKEQNIKYTEIEPCDINDSDHLIPFYGSVSETEEITKPVFVLDSIQAEKIRNKLNHLYIFIEL